MKKVIFTIITSALVLTVIAQNKNDNKLEFIKSSQEFEPKSTFQIKLADLDMDGDLDAVAANMHENFSQVLLNDGKGNYTDSGQKLTQKGHGVAIGDLDNDGDNDIVITCANGDRKTKIYFNDGKANFVDSGQDIDDFELSGNSVDLIDIDCDSDLDFVIDYYKHPHLIYLNDGNGNFTKSEFELQAGIVPIFGYLNQDSFIDIFIKIPGQGYRVVLNDGKGNFSEVWEHEDTLCTHGYYSIAIADFDKDGDNDAFICNGDHSTFSESKFFTNNGNGIFVDTQKRFGKTKWAWTNIGDLNNDGYIDIFISNFFQPNEVWLNDGNGSFYDSELRLSGDAATRGFSMGDIDNDGDIDVFIGNFLNGSNEIWINNLNKK